MPTRFYKPNVPNRAMSKPIPDDIWEANRPFIEEEREKGTSIEKIAHILSSRPDPNFAPSASQLRHRIKHKWRAKERRDISAIPQRVSNSTRNAAFGVQNDFSSQTIHPIDNLTSFEIDGNPFNIPNTSWILPIGHTLPNLSPYDPRWTVRSPNLNSINHQQLFFPSSSNQQLPAMFEMFPYPSNDLANFSSYTQSDSPTIGNFGPPEETDILRIILFILENDLLRTAPYGLRQTLLSHTRSIHPQSVTEVLRLSLNNSLDDETSEKAFLFAVEAGNHGLTQIFIDGKIKLTSTSAVKAYNMALKDENLNLVRFMLSAYVDLSMFDPFSYFGSLRKPLNSLFSLSSWGSVYTTRQGWNRKVKSSLEFACLRRNYELVDLLLCAGASTTHVPGYIDEESGEFIPPESINPVTAALSTITDDFVWLRKQSDSISIVKRIIERLVEKEADVNSSSGCAACSSSNHCPTAVPIIEAASQLHLDIIRYLLEKGAQVHERSMGRSVLLYIAASQWSLYSTASAQALIKAGVDVNQKIAVKEITFSDDARRWTEVKLQMCKGDRGSYVEIDAVSALELAVETGNMEFINILLDAKPQDELPIPYQLLAAIRGQDPRSANLLLGSGVVPKNPLDAVQEALRNSMPEIVYFLIELAQENGNSWPTASNGRQLEVGTIQFLLNAECTPEFVALWEALDVATDHGDTALVQRLLTINNESDHGSMSSQSSALLKAVHGGHEAIVKLLLDHGATPSDEEINAALRNRNRSILRLLCGYQKYTFNIKQENFPFILDLDLSQDPVAALVLEHRASTCSACRLPRFPERDPYSRFPGRDPYSRTHAPFPTWMIERGNLKLISMAKELHVPMEEEWITEAVRFDQFAMLVALLDQFQAQADPHSPAFGMEALIEAVQTDSIRAVDKLLTFGVNPVYRDPSKYRYYTSALGAAIKKAPSSVGTRMLHALLESVPDKDCIVGPFYGISCTALLAAIEVGNLSYATILIDAGADVDLPPTKKTQRTPLQAACATGNKKMVKLLLGRGADIHTPAFRYKGATALQFAAMSGQIEILLDLLHRGADVNAPAARFDGRTAIQGAAEHGRVSAVKLLLDYGVKINGEYARQYKRALELAVKNGHRKVKSILEEAKESTLLRDASCFECR